MHKDRLVVRLKDSLAQTKLLIPQMIGRSQFPGRNRHPKDPARSCSRTMHPKATSVRNSSSAGRAWSAPSREAVGGWMMLSQVALPRSPSFAPARSAAFGRSI
jgi:hypothetical protein